MMTDIRANHTHRVLETSAQSSRSSNVRVLLEKHRDADGSARRRTPSSSSSSSFEAAVEGTSGCSSFRSALSSTSSSSSSSTKNGVSKSQPTPTRSSSEGSLQNEQGEPSRLSAQQVCVDRLVYIPSGCLYLAFRFLSSEDILLVGRVCRVLREAVHEIPGAFASTRHLAVDRTWVALGRLRRQRAFLQMRQLHHLRISPDVFGDGGVSLMEVAALVARNSWTLKSIFLASPDTPLKDYTPSHAPFAFRPLSFGRLLRFTIAGCQAFEWLHIFCNCAFPQLERFELVHYPLPPEHWSWKVLPDFTNLGIRGLERMLDAMPQLGRLSLGLHIRKDEVASPRSSSSAAGDSHGETLEGTDSGNLAAPSPLAGEVISLGDGWEWQSSSDFVGWRVSHLRRLAEEGVLPLGGRSRLRSWRGQVSEEDLSDLFAIAYVRSGGAGSLKRIVLKQRTPVETGTTATGAEVSVVKEFLEGAASFCVRYVSDMWNGIGGNA